jgi:hypothetical protein
LRGLSLANLTYWKYLRNDILIKFARNFLQAFRLRTKMKHRRTRNLSLPNPVNQREEIEMVRPKVKNLKAF